MRASTGGGWRTVCLLRERAARRVGRQRGSMTARRREDGPRAPAGRALSGALPAGPISPARRRKRSTASVAASTGSTCRGARRRSSRPPAAPSGGARPSAGSPRSRRSARTRRRAPRARAGGGWPGAWGRRRPAGVGRAGPRAASWLTSYRCASVFATVDTTEQPPPVPHRLRSERLPSRRGAHHDRPDPRARTGALRALRIGRPGCPGAWLLRRRGHGLLRAGDRARAGRSTARSSSMSCPMRRSSPRWAAATPPPWPTCTKASGSWTWAAGAASTCCSRLVVSDRRAASRPGHDRRDAGSCRAQHRRVGRHERGAPQGPHRGHPPAGGVGRRGHQQLRRQPGRGQARRVPGDRPRAAPRWPRGHHGYRGRGPAVTPPSDPSGAATPAASPEPCPVRSSRTACEPSASRNRASRPRMPSPTACRVPSCEPGSRPRGGRPAGPPTSCSNGPALMPERPRRPRFGHGSARRPGAPGHGRPGPPRSPAAGPRCPRRA